MKKVGIIPGTRGASPCVREHVFTGKVKKKKELSYVTAASVIFTAFDLVQRGVREVELLSTVIYGQAIGGFNVTADDHDHIGSIQRGPHNARRLLIPVGPEH